MSYSTYIKATLASAAAAFLVASCGGEAPPPPPPAKKAEQPVVKPQAAQAAAQGDAQAPTSAAPSSGGVKRNPFLSYIIVARGVDHGNKRIAGPLECCDVNSFKVLAVVASRDGAYALVQAPDKKRYIVRRGDAMGQFDGRVTKVDMAGITVREVVKDESGRVVSSSEVELRLPNEK